MEGLQTSVLALPCIEKAVWNAVVDHRDHLVWVIAPLGKPSARSLPREPSNPDHMADLFIETYRLITYEAGYNPLRVVFFEEL